MDKIIDTIKGFFSTPDKAIMSIFAVVAAVIVIGTGATFASVYWDLNEDRVENAVTQTIKQAKEDPAADEQAAEDQAAEGQAAEEPAAEGRKAEDSTAEDSASKEQLAEDQEQSGWATEESATASEGAADNSSAGNTITNKEAEDIALADAGFGRGDVEHLTSHREMDDGFHQYEVQFFRGDMEYEYAIGAEDGEIYEIDTDSIYD